MVYPLLKFVAAPSLDAAVRLDLNEDSRHSGIRLWPGKNGWTIGNPTMEGDPDGIGVEYGPRTLSFTLNVEGAKPLALAKHSAVARELLRDGNWLLFQLSPTTAPVWFHTYRTQPGELSFEHVTSGGGLDRWRIAMTLTAEPFAVGARVVLDPVTIRNNPAATGGGVLPARVVLPEILGDAPTPLRVELSPSNRGVMSGFRWLMHNHATDGPAVAPIVWDIGTGDAWTAGTDTGAGVANAAYVGGSYRPVTFATVDVLVDRIKGVAPTPVPNGRYRVLARVARSDTDSTFQLRFGSYIFLGYRYGDTAVMDREPSGSAGHATWVDLGDFNFPVGASAPPAYGLTAPAPDVALQVARTSGTGQARIDAIMLIPIDVATTVETRTLTASSRVAAFFDNNGWDVWDGDVEGYWKTTPDRTAGVASLVPTHTGGFLRAVPDATNVLTLLQNLNGPGFNGQDNHDNITADTHVVLSYHPQHLWIGDR